MLDESDVEETKEIASGVYVDYDSDGRVLAIEFLNASDKYDLRWEEFEEPGPFYSLAQAAEVYGLSPTTLRHQIQKGVLNGTKFGRNWMVHRDAVEEYLATHSRKARQMTRVPDSSGRTWRNATSADGPDDGFAYRVMTRKREVLQEGFVGKSRIRERLGRYSHKPDDQRK